MAETAKVAEPVAVGRDDVPRSLGGRGLGQRVLEGAHVVVPPGALLEVAERELPALARVVVALLEPLALLVARSMCRKNLTIVVPVSPAAARTRESGGSARHTAGGTSS
jgi:hypothetical protein